MKLLKLDSNYYRFPEGVKTADEFAELANNSSQKFVKLTMYSEEHCMEPYFIEEDKKTVWVNLSQITYIEEIDGEVMPRIDYECRLRQVVREKCLDCVFTGSACGSAFYSIIGRRTPKSLHDAAKAEKYQKRYDALVAKYQTRENPPWDDEKD